MRKFKNKIICGDCIDLLGKVKTPFVDLVFADPPYLTELSNKILSALDNCSVLSADPLIIIEERKNFTPPEHLNKLYLKDNRSYGESSFYFYGYAAS